VSGTDVPSGTRSESDLERLAFERILADLSVCEASGFSAAPGQATTKAPAA
jgi:hypothetical protein